MRFALLSVVLIVAGCQESGPELNENEIANRAAAISESANATVAAQIADIEQDADADAAAIPVSPPANAANATEGASK